MAGFVKLSGKDGKSAYEIWLEQGNTGTEEDFLNSLKGEKGEKGDRGLKGEHGIPGETGPKGEDGKDGTSVTITKVTESNVDGGSNVVTFSDGKTLSVKNGSKGSDGTNGTNGKDGANGQDGVSPTVSVNKSGKVTTITITDKNGTKTATINDGADGANGKDGYTPINGVDFYTESEKEDFKSTIAQEILSSLQGLPIFGIVGENNIITVTSQLSDGTYLLKYENEDGTTTEIGTIIVGSGKAPIINLLETALTPNDITTVFDGKGYKNGYYASAAEPFYNTDAAFFCTGLMVIPEGRTFYIKGCTIDTSLSHTRFGLHGPNNENINASALSGWGNNITLTQLGEQYYSVYISDVSYEVRPYYFYFSASGTGEGVIVSATPIE